MYGDVTIIFGNTELISKLLRVILNLRGILPLSDRHRVRAKLASMMNGNEGRVGGAHSLAEPAWDRLGARARVGGWACALCCVYGACVGARAPNRRRSAILVARRCPRRPCSGRGCTRIYGAYRIRSDGACASRAADSPHHRRVEEPWDHMHGIALPCVAHARAHAPPGAVDTVRRMYLLHTDIDADADARIIKRRLPGGLRCPRARCAHGKRSARCCSGELIRRCCPMIMRPA